MFKVAVLGGVYSAREKQALLSGAEEPAYLAEGAVPYHVRQRAADKFLRQKATEEVEALGPQLAKGVGYGALAGGIPLALAGGVLGGGQGAAIGGIGGASLGALLGAINRSRAVNYDREMIETAKRHLQDPEALDEFLAGRISSKANLEALNAAAYQQAMLNR